MLTVDAVSATDSPLYAAVVDIYRGAFPGAEREPEAVLAERVAAGRYRLFAGRETGGHPVGFYVLEPDAGAGYTFLAYLAVAPGRRGGGLGTALGRDALARFRRTGEGAWLLAEAGDRQARFYGRLGFRRLDIEYAAPAFGTGDSVPMHLMAAAAGAWPETIAGATLAAMVRHNFVHGYRLSARDPRLAARLAGIPPRVRALAWPPGE